MPEAIVFDIQRYSLHDGPGIRTLVFFKGCPLRCGWCCNPESQVSAPEYAHDPEKCRQCLICQKVCPFGAVFVADGCPKPNMDLCAGCKKHLCENVCPEKCFYVYGQKWTPEALLQEVKKDEVFFYASGGGVTATGGEALLQPDFLRAFFALCRAEGYSTAVETCLHVGWEAVEKVLPETDLFCATSNTPIRRAFARQPAAIWAW